MEIHSILKSLNDIDEEMIAEADRFMNEKRLHQKGKRQYFLTGITAAAAMLLAVIGIVFFSLKPANSPMKDPDKNIVVTTKENTEEATTSAETDAQEKIDSRVIAEAVADYPQSMLDYIDTVSDEWLEQFLVYAKTDAPEFIVMEPFQTWNQTPTEEKCSDGYLLPVICDNRVICTVAIYQLDDTWHYSLSDDLCEELTSLIGGTQQARIIYHFDESGNYTQTTLSYEKAKSKNIGELMIITNKDELMTK